MSSKLRNIRSLGFAVLLIFVAQFLAVHAATPTPTPTATPTPTPAPTAVPAQTAAPLVSHPVYPAGFQVTDVYEGADKQNHQIALYHTITVEVDKLDEFLKQQGADPAKFVLYLNWRPLKGLNVRVVDSENKLMFDIKRTDESQKEWDALLGRPFYGGKHFTYKLPVSIGYDNDPPVKSLAKSELVVVNKIGFWVFLVIFVLSLYLFWWLATHKGIIRDPCEGIPENKRPYSLGRTQMAFWFFVIATSYFLIWMITSNPESLTPEALALLGISTATALGAAVVGSSRRNGAETRKKDLELERDTLKKRLEQLVEEKAKNTGDKLTELNKEEAEKSARLTQVEKEIEALAAPPSKPVNPSSKPGAEPPPGYSRGFLNDILSDDEGISLHRFQMAIWTIVLGVIFVASVYNNLAMPAFSGTLLALMGISGGTYIGFKYPEKPR